MKYKILIFLLVYINCQGFAQSKDFEGVVTYKVAVKPKQEGVTEKTMKTILATGDNLVAWIKQGNYRQSSGACDVYYINKDQRVYYKFKSLDTLYYIEYNYDTNKVINFSKEKEQLQIAGYTCNIITIQTSGGTRKYSYSPLLHINPEYDKQNTSGNYNLYIKETESVWLRSEDDAPNYNVSQTATKVEKKDVDDHVFDLPRLPQKGFVPSTLIKEPEFAKYMGWNKYLQTTINTEVGAKYIKIPKGESGATQTPLISFMISETGQVLNAKVENAREIHPKVAEEAIRVVMESRGWKPATVYGEKINFWLKQGITFQVSK